MILKPNTGEPTLVLDDLPLYWQMTRPEKFTFRALVEGAKPEVAIEIGTFKGGSLQIISEHAKKVYSLDISPDCRDSLQDRFDNVDFRVGDSKAMVADVLREIEESGQQLGFVLIDGDHSTAAVRGDINAILKHKPTRDVFIVFHDSFNPACREGILSADWVACPYIHYVEIDFVQGVFHAKGEGNAQDRSMWGGLAVALMKPEKRDFELTILQSQEGLFDTVYATSCHVPPPKAPPPSPPTFIEKVQWRLRKMLS